MRHRFVLHSGAIACAIAIFTGALIAQEPYSPEIAPASDEAEKAIKKFAVAEGFEVDALHDPPARHVETGNDAAG